MVIELHVTLTPLMSTIQTAVLDIVHFIVKEIKRLNSTVGFPDFSISLTMVTSHHKNSST